jgi:hypothetical protein
MCAHGGKKKIGGCSDAKVGRLAIFRAQAW